MLPEDLEGVLLENNLKIIRRLGEGGMGVVYEGTQSDLSRSVCVKFLRSELVSDYEHFKRFQREVRAMSALLSSAGIARIYSIGSFLGVYPYIVMELVEGATLRDVITRRKMSPEEVCKLFIQICRSLSVVHNQGFIHRDLKPENIMVKDTSNTLEVKILDFGLCGLLQGRDESVTHTEELLGSFFYMAPECFTGAQYSPAVDIYALGCIIYEILAEAPPFCPRELGLLARLHTCQRFPKLPDNDLDSKHLIPALQPVLEKACAKTPSMRYQTTEEFAVSLEKVLTARSKRSTPTFTPVFLFALMAISLSLLLLQGHKMRPSTATRLEECQSQAGRLAYFRQFLNSCHSRKGMSCNWSLYQVAFETVFSDQIRKGNLQEAFAFTSDCFSWIHKRTSAQSLVCQCVTISRAECALVLGLYAESERCLRVLSLNQYPRPLDIPRWVRANIILARALARQNKGEEAAAVLNSCINKLCVSGVAVQKRTCLWNATTGDLVQECGTEVQTPEKISQFVEGQLRLTLSEILLDLRRPKEATIQLKALRVSKWRPTTWTKAASSYIDYYKTLWPWFKMEQLELDAVYYCLVKDDRYMNYLAQAIETARSCNLVIDEARLRNRFLHSCKRAYADSFVVFNAVPPLVWKQGTLIKSPSFAQIDEALLYLESVRAPLILISSLRLRKAQCLIKEGDFKRARQLARSAMTADVCCESEACIIIHHCDLKLQGK